MDLSTAFEFVRDHKHGVLATQKRDGRPQLSNIIYSVLEDDTIRISVTDTRAKARNMRRDARVSLHVARDDFYAYIVLDGVADLSPVVTSIDDPSVDDHIAQYRALAGEHPDWDEYRQSLVDEGRLLASVRAEHAYGMLPS